MDYILKTTTGKLHKSLCAKGKTPNRKVGGGFKNHYFSIENAKKDDRYKSCHINKHCISKKDC